MFASVVEPIFTLAQAMVEAREEEDDDEHDNEERRLPDVVTMAARVRAANARNAHYQQQANHGNDDFEPESTRQVQPNTKSHIQPQPQKTTQTAVERCQTKCIEIARKSSKQEAAPRVNIANF